jgi:2'-5' RNA ligase
MRYFLGIQPPDVLMESVARFRQLYGVQEMEPHITVKAPCGLNGQADWLPSVRQLCQGVAAFPIEISGVGAFGSSVLFLRVVSPALLTLHHSLLQELHISSSDQNECYEGMRYTPHLTLTHQQALGYCSIDTAASVASSHFHDVMSFQANALTVYCKLSEGTYQVLDNIPFCGNP